MDIRRALRAWCWRIWLNRWVVRWLDRRHRGEAAGPRGERLAERYLLQRGHLIIARNYRTRHSEIDLITVDGRTLVFVEVKTRTQSGGESPAEAVDDEKQRRLSRGAAEYLQRHHLQRVKGRFDVIAITLAESGEIRTLQHFVNAFETMLDH